MQFRVMGGGQSQASRSQSEAGARSSKTGLILGYPIRGGQWCTSDLKRRALSRASLLPRESDIARNSKTEFSKSSLAQGAKINIVQYLGIAADEPERIARHTKPGFMLPLVEAGWDEAYCRQWCEEHDLLSPIYTNATRGGAGSATTKALTSFVYSAKITPICGRCF